VCIQSSRDGVDELGLVQARPSQCVVIPAESVTPIDHQCEILALFVLASLFGAATVLILLSRISHV
ncbi:MAG: hypothetical protein ABIQ09_14585, partial [Jatrophihabitantaceae bacterium]